MRGLFVLCGVVAGCNVENLELREQAQTRPPKAGDIVIKHKGNPIQTIKCYREKPPLTQEETSICANAIENGRMPTEITVQKVKVCEETGKPPPAAPEECKDAIYFIYTWGENINKRVEGNLAPPDDPTNSKRKMYPKIPNPKQPTPADPKRPGSGHITLPKGSPGNTAARGALGFLVAAIPAMSEYEFFVECNMPGPTPPDDFAHAGEIVTLTLVSSDGTQTCDTIVSAEDAPWIDAEADVEVSSEILANEFLSRSAN